MKVALRVTLIALLALHAISCKRDDPTTSQREKLIASVRDAWDYYLQHPNSLPLNSPADACKLGAFYSAGEQISKALNMAAQAGKPITEQEAGFPIELFQRTHMEYTVRYLKVLVQGYRDQSVLPECEDIPFYRRKDALKAFITHNLKQQNIVPEAVGLTKQETLKLNLEP